MGKNQSPIAKWSLAISIICAGAASLMVFGSSIGLWDPITGFTASRQYNNLLGYIAVTIAFVSFIISLSYHQGKQVFQSSIALLLGIGILLPSINDIINPPPRYPAIHDITTNLQSPPHFEYLTDPRPNSKNTLVYGGEDVAKQQLQAYPDIKPIMTKLTKGNAYRKAIDVANNMDWEIIHQSPSLFRFESTARTPYFNFADDIVIQITSENNLTRVDIRSVSRIGRGDRGVNAKRIREFIQSFVN